MKLSQVVAKLTNSKRRVLGVMGGLAFAGMTSFAAVPAATAQVSFGVAVGTPRYYAPAPVYVAPGYGNYGNDGYARGYAPGYGNEGYARGYAPDYRDHFREDQWRAREFRAQQFNDRREWNRRDEERFDDRRYDGRGWR